VGELYIEEGVCEISGKFLSGHTTFETLPCVHCGAIMRVVITGLNKNLETDARCHKCNGPICKYCARLFEKEGCDSLKAKIDRARQRADQLSRHI
jgi:hypothetical protein